MLAFANFEELCSACKTLMHCFQLASRRRARSEFSFVTALSPLNERETSPPSTSVARFKGCLLSTLCLKVDFSVESIINKFMVFSSHPTPCSHPRRGRGRINIEILIVSKAGKEMEVEKRLQPHVTKSESSAFILRRCGVWKNENPWQIYELLISLPSLQLCIQK